MRQFSREYLETTREGMWADSRAALDPLGLGDCERVLDVGCGNGAFTRVLRDETPGTVVGVDADATLLGHVDPPVVQADAMRLPFPDDAVDLVVCQALLVNLPDPDAAVAEFARVASDAVAAVEPDNAAVSVTSTVDAEAPLARQARECYLDGASARPSLGGEIGEVLRAAGLTDVRTRRYDHERTIDPPYSESALEDARRKASGAGLDADRATIVAGETTPEEYDELRASWREMGRDVVAQMQADEYRRSETVPFHVSVGRV